MVTSKIIRAQLSEMPTSTIYSRKDAIKKKTGNSISDEVALDILASQEGIDVYDALKKEGRNGEIEQFRDAISKFDFDGKIPLRKRVNQPPELKPDRSPYDIPLAKFGLDEELVRDCKIQKPYRKAVSEALLTLETRMRNKLNLPDSCVGVALIDEAQRKGVFKRSVRSEEEGLTMLYRGAIMWLRNPSGHRKTEFTREDAVKIVLFSDYLIRLFEEMVSKKP